MATKTPNPTRDEKYYFETVTFQVEDRLFRVPRYHFERNSELFETTFSLPAGQQAEVEGLSDQNPFKLDGVSSLDFERLLAVLYPLEIPIPTMSKECWISILKLTTLWRFLGMRKCAISNLDSDVKHTVEGIILARKYHVAAWLRSAYQALVAAPSPAMSLEDAETIGWETATKIYRMREGKRTGQTSQSYCNTCSRYTNLYLWDGTWNCSNCRVPEAHDLEFVFAVELQRMDKDSAEYDLKE